jgi:hypothetical protein
MNFIKANSIYITFINCYQVEQVTIRKHFIGCNKWKFGEQHRYIHLSDSRLDLNYLEELFKDFNYSSLDKYIEVIIKKMTVLFKSYEFKKFI